MNGNPFNVNYFDAIHCCMKYSASLTLVKLHELFFDYKIIDEIYLFTLCFTLLCPEIERSCDVGAYFW